MAINFFLIKVKQKTLKQRRDCFGYMSAASAMLSMILYFGNRRSVGRYVDQCQAVTWPVLMTYRQSPCPPGVSVHTAHISNSNLSLPTSWYTCTPQQILTARKYCYFLMILKQWVRRFSALYLHRPFEEQ